MPPVIIAPTAIVKDAKLGEGVKIWNFANVYGCKIGDNTSVGSYTEVQAGAKIGNNVIVSSHSFICDLVTIEDDVFIGHGVMTINDLYPPSRRKTGTTDHWKSTLIKKGVIIGSNATLFPVIIGENAIIGAGSVVTKDVPDGEVWAGNPARFIKKVPENPFK